ncbi:MAG TPA: hypothetical protein VGK05_00535 [Acidimicrobiia bacterium]
MTEHVPTPEDEARARERLEETAAAIVAGVEIWVPRWVEAQVTRLLEAWGRVAPDARAEAEAQAVAAGEAAARRIAGRLRELFATEPERQPATPLEIVRTVYREPTQVLASAGVPPVLRDPFEERSWPDDLYALVPRTLGDLGDPDLGPLHLAWGMAKATVIRARRSA